MASFRHVVLFRLHEGVSGADRRRAIDLLNQLGQMPGIREWRIAESLDERKGLVIAELALFDDRDAFARFQESSEHRRVADFMSGLADWWVADFEERS